MMNNIIKKIVFAHIAIVLSIFAFIQCTPIDHHYSDFLENAERVYPGRVDSIVFRSGNERAAIRTFMSTDSRVNKIRVTWTGGSYEIDVTPNDIANHKEFVIPDITEGVYTFEIRTIDTDGNQSMRSEVFGRVYGPVYVENLNNRIIYDAVESDEEGLILNWIPEAADTTLIGVEMEYQTKSGNQETKLIAGRVESNTIPDVKVDAPARFRTMYKPSSLALDTFYATWVDFVPNEFIEPDRDLYDRESWTIAGFSSENNNGRHAVKHILDNSSETFWIARYESPGTSYPNHWITIDMQEVREVDGFMFAQKNGDRKIREMEIQISNDNQTWETLPLIGLANVDRVYQYFDIPTRKSFRYFKIIPRNGHDNQQAPGLAEAGTFKFSH